MGSSGNSTGLHLHFSVHKGWIDATQRYNQMADPQRVWPPSKGLVEAESRRQPHPQLAIKHSSPPLRHGGGAFVVSGGVVAADRRPLGQISHQVPDDAKIRPAVGLLGFDHRQQPGCAHVVRHRVSTPSWDAVEPGLRCRGVVNVSVSMR